MDWLRSSLKRICAKKQVNWVSLTNSTNSFGGKQEAQMFVGSLGKVCSPKKQVHDHREIIAEKLPD